LSILHWQSSNRDSATVLIAPPPSALQAPCTFPLIDLAAAAAAAAAAACRNGRPFYFHTDDNSLRQMFVALNKKGMMPKPSKLPDV
jgi:hypothetical protein